VTVETVCAATSPRTQHGSPPALRTPGRATRAQPRGPRLPTGLALSYNPTRGFTRELLSTDHIV